MRKNNNNNIIAIEKKKKLNDSHNKLNSIDYFEHMYSGNLLENVIGISIKSEQMFSFMFFSLSFAISKTYVLVHVLCWCYFSCSSICLYQSRDKNGISRSTCKVQN